MGYDKECICVKTNKVEINTASRKMRRSRCANPETELTTVTEHQVWLGEQVYKAVSRKLEPGKATTWWLILL